ncbi:acetyltransferase [Puniceicoccus vermicola]|uniref:Acetyltransferase n=1 Tax=Puniceicoccus vermicola TaxID=388746 RepID=A0A7X1AYK2_9BACT|nr:acetyltransferase [Puniceicoccus vermicola]MBC2601215.1 acetyltransferase [Puniceicoccus vermicola]
MSSTKPLVIIGAGGHGVEVLWLAKNINKVAPTYEILGFCDDDRKLLGKTISGFPVLGGMDDVASSLQGPVYFQVGIGNNATRRDVARRAESLGWIPETLIDPSAAVAEDIQLGAGCYVGVCSNISPTAKIGRHVIVHNQSSVGHDTEMADFSQVAPGGRVLGHVTVGECGYLGSNAVVYPNKSVGAHAVLGACSFALTNIPDGAVAMGVPARIRTRHPLPESSTP